MSATVSVVIPLFNGMPYVKQALQSVLDQTHPVDQIVITDGGSTDGSLEWMRELDLPNLLTEELPQGTTAAENWTRCSELATGDFVKLLCQDDFLYPEAIGKQVTDLINSPSCDMAIARRDVVDANGSRIAGARGCQGLPAGQVSGLTAIRTSYLKGTNIFGEPVTTLFRRAPMHAALPWLDDKPYVLDIYFDTAILTKSSVFVRHESLGAFRVSSSSWSTQLAKVQMKQFRAWQGYAQSLLETSSRLDRLRAALSLRFQTQLRRIAYAYLRASRSLGS